MGFDLDLCAVRDVAKSTVATTGYVATVATVATKTTGQDPANSANPANFAQPASPLTLKSPNSVATVATVATVASSQRLATHQKTTKKPELSHLMALAMAYCHQIGASDKARAAWQADIEATPPELREDLAGYLQGHLPRKLPPPPLVPAPKPMPFFSVSQPWRINDRDYQNHHWGCGICSNIHTKRCEEGERLYSLYKRATQEAIHPPIKGKTK